MADKVVINKVEFNHFKAFEKFSVAIKDMNLLVGPNNSGKSTILNAFRVLGAGLRKANSKQAEIVPGPTQDVYGYVVNTEDLPVSLENVHTNYDDKVHTTVKFHLSNKNSLMLYFRAKGSTILIPITEARLPRTPSNFKKQFPLNVSFIPVLGPVEHDEPIVEESTIRRGLSTHRASRHFRNYWLNNPQDFPEFAQLIEETWSDIKINFPERVGIQNKLAMFCDEGRIPRELYWAGFGFQVWCQLLTHIVRSKDADLLIVDEPEIYLHPDLQRRLLSILRRIRPDVLLATHSTEIVSEAEPSEILIIDKSKNAALRLKEIKHVQSAMDILGSGQNMTLTQLARNKRVLFVEGTDYKILGKFAEKMRLTEVSNKTGFSVVATGGFSEWKKILGLAWGIEETLGQRLVLGAVFDRDFYSDEEIQDILVDLDKAIKFSHIHQRKELENYLLLPDVLDKAIRKSLKDYASRTGKELPEIPKSAEILDLITTPMRGDLQAQYIAKRRKYLEKSALDEATINKTTIVWFDEKWHNIYSRMEIVGGKQVFSLLNKYLSENFRVNLTPTKVINECTVEDIPSDLRDFLRKLDRFRKFLTT